MEVDLLLDVGSESLNCCSGWMEYIIEKGLSTKNGRIGLILSKIVGLIFDIIAIIVFVSSSSEEECEEECIAKSEYGYADDDCIDNCMGGGYVTSVGNILITLFVFDRVLVIPLILIYGWNPETNEKYQIWLNKYITENEKINSKYGLTSLWYGALFNFPDFAAKQWIIDTQVICGNIGCIYISFILIEGFILLLFIVFSFSNFFFADKEYQKKNWSSNLILGITSIAVGIGVVQHYMNIAYTLRSKSHYKSGITSSSKKQKHAQIPVTAQQQIQYNQQIPVTVQQQQQQQPVIQQSVIQQQPQQQQQEQYMMVQMANGQMVMVKTLPTDQPQYGYPPQPVMVTQQQQPQQQQQQVVYMNTQNTHIPQDNMTTNNNNNNINDGKHAQKKEAATCGDKCVYSCGSCCFYFCMIFAGCYGLTFCGMTFQALIWMCLAFV